MLSFDLILLSSPFTLYKRKERSGFKTYLIANMRSHIRKEVEEHNIEYDRGYLTKEYAHELYLLPNTSIVKWIPVTTM